MKRLQKLINAFLNSTKAILIGLLLPFDLKDLSGVIRTSLLLLFILTIFTLWTIRDLQCSSGVGSITFLETAVACFAFGSAIGFLFGMPKAQKDFKTDGKYVDNTALEDISDWFTKIILGLSLVEARSIFRIVENAAERLNETFKGYCSCESICNGTDFFVFSYATICVYFLAGTGICYLWTRVNLPEIFTGSIFAKKDSQIAKIEDQNKGLIKTAQEVAQKVIGREARVDVPSPDFSKEITQIYSGKKVFDQTDIQRGRWGESPKVGDFILSASYDATRTFGMLYGVNLSVKSISNPNWDGEVAFFLHDSFLNEIEFVKANGGEAKLEDISAFEAFVVGARTADGTELELDLNQVRGFPEDFYWT